jgi:hypothetical protein
MAKHETGSVAPAPCSEPVVPDTKASKLQEDEEDVEEEIHGPLVSDERQRVTNPYISIRGKGS